MSIDSLLVAVVVVVAEILIEVWVGFVEAVPNLKESKLTDLVENLRKPGFENPPEGLM